MTPLGKRLYRDASSTGGTMPGKGTRPDNTKVWNVTTTMVRRAAAGLYKDCIHICIWQG